MEEKLLEVKNLCTSFLTPRGELKAVDDVSFSAFAGKTLGIVGESGCGKSVTSLSIMRLLAKPAGRVRSGEILYRGRNLLELSEPEMRKIRGNEISMIFQEPMTSLNPVFTIGDQINEVLQLHQGLSFRDARLKSIEMLELVGIPSPSQRIDEYPHQLSGGMRQRVMIAMALSCNPKLLIADEPTTALDVTVQAQILDLLRDLQQKLGMALILITHDLGVVAEVAHDVVVMYAGRVVEQASVVEIFKSPKMPYTRGLLRSSPRLGLEKKDSSKQARLEVIPGIVPNLLELPSGCRFQERCSYVIEECRRGEPGLRSIAGAEGRSHWIRCLRDI